MGMRRLALGSAAVLALSWLVSGLGPRAAATVAAAASPAPVALRALLPADPALPPLPERSPRNASYSIDARLDPERHTVEGTLVLDWRNIGPSAGCT